MGNYDEEVGQRLGSDAVELILNDVRSGKMDAQQMKDFAQRLKPATIGGRHSNRDQVNDAAMRDILSDWYWLGDLHKMTREQALTELVTILRDPCISMKPLAANLERLLENKPYRLQLSSVTSSSTPSCSLPPTPITSSSPEVSRSHRQLTIGKRAKDRPTTTNKNQQPTIKNSFVILF